MFSTYVFYDPRRVSTLLERFRRVADTNTHTDIEPYAFASSELCSFVSQNSNEYPQLKAQESAINQMAALMDFLVQFSFSEAWWLTNVQLHPCMIPLIDMIKTWYIKK